MAHDRGFVLLDRSLFGTAAFHNHNMWRVYTWALGKATHTESSVSINTGRGQTVISLQRGQFIFGRKVAASELGMKPSTVRNAMHNLEKHGFLAMQPDTHYTLVTILNYNESQDITTYMRTGKRTSKGQAKDTYKEHKEHNTQERKRDKGAKKILHSPLYFPLWKELNGNNTNGNTVPLRDDIAEAIQYYMDAYQARFGKPHPPLRGEQWAELVDSLPWCGEDEYSRDYDLDGDGLIAMIDQHFDTEYTGECDYNILHFNSNGIKLRRMFETCY
jgi:biotin operon repressor